MTHEEFYVKFLDHLQPAALPRGEPRRPQPAWVARASLATADPETVAAPSCEGRVVGRIAGGRIIPIGDPGDLT